MTRSTKRRQHFKLKVQTIDGRPCCRLGIQSVLQMTTCFGARYVPALGISGVCIRFVACKSHALALIVAEFVLEAGNSKQVILFDFRQTPVLPSDTVIFYVDLCILTLGHE